MEYRNPSRNSFKEYRVELIEMNNNKLHVAYSYGRIGSKLKHDTKTTNPLCEGKAWDLYWDTIEEKQKEGYKII
jgi:predicted DNA-binding WGR domain protein